jgi:hypothetical protein
MSRPIRVFLLVSVLFAVGFVAYSRGSDLRLGGAPATLHGEYSSEEAWIVTEIVRDITEMSAYAGGKSVSGKAIRLDTVDDGIYRIPAQGPLRQSVDLNLRQDLWAPSDFAAIARGALGQDGRAVQTPASLSGLRAALLNLTPQALVQANQSVSRALDANMRDPRAHEAAALTLAAFALREAAKDFSDIRWALNRMTAHLAMAGALRQGLGADADGVIAEAARLTLSNHQVRAETLIQQLKKNSDPTVQSWVRVLELRLSQDWRQIPAPKSASLLEKQEYFRARRATVPRRSALGELASIEAPENAEWFRIMQASSGGVEDKWMITKDAYRLEWEEAAEVFALFHNRKLGTHIAKDLNARATRCITDGKPQVLPWGAWAEFFQRHLAMHIVHLQRFYQDTLAAPVAADEVGRALRDEFKQLTLFPVASAYWTKGPRGGEADFTYINQAIALAAAAPELVTSRPWYFLEVGANYEAVKHGMPSGASWFVPLSPRAPYDAGWRVNYFSPRPDVDQMASLVQEAPRDLLLVNSYVTSRYGGNPPAAELRRLVGTRVDYDLRAIDWVVGSTRNAGERIALLERSCGISAVECSELGRHLAFAGLAEEAAAQYEKAFADPEMDAVSLSNQSRWLVDYHYRRGRTNAALALAERSSDTGSARGEATAAHLYEILGRTDEAEALYRHIADRYQDQSRLLGFYYRQVNTSGRDRYQKTWDALLARVFPEGLVDVSAAQSQPPAHGVVVTKDSDFSRRAGLQAGDIIVGLDGRRVENLPQYYAVNSFPETEQMKLTVWRGVRFEVAVTAPNRLMGIEFRTYPIRGSSD